MTSGADGGEKSARKRKSMWDTDKSGKETKSVPGESGGILPPPPPAVESVDLMAQAQLQQQLALQQQQLLLAMAQQRMAEVAAQQPALQGTAVINKANRIYVGNLFYELTETEILLAFSVFGAILKIDMPKDPATGRHKGFCFIEFATADSASSALSTMQDFILAGRPIKVGRPNNFAATVNPSSSMVFANVAQQAQLLQASGLGMAAAPSANLIQAKLQAQAVAAAISQQKVLTPADTSASALALAAQSGVPNTKIYVGSIYYEIKEDDIKAIFSAFGPIRSCQLLQNPETGKHKGYGFIDYESEASATAAIASMNGFELAGRPIKVGRASATNTPLPGMTGPGTVASAPGDGKESQPKPSRCVVLLNMVGPDEVDEELKAEVTEECGKYGTVEKVVIYQEDETKQLVDAPVRIFVLFSSEDDSQKAVKALHGRWFGGRQVLARFFEIEKFEKDDFSV